MHAEVISIGDELTSGQRLDTNSQWLSTRLGELGVSVMYHTTVADNLEANVEVFRSRTTSRHHYLYQRPGSHGRRFDTRRVGRCGRC